MHVGPLVVAVAGDLDALPVQVVGLDRQFLDRLGAVLDLLLVEAGDLPQAFERQRICVVRFRRRRDLK